MTLLNVDHRRMPVHRGNEDVAHEIVGGSAAIGPAKNPQGRLDQGVLRRVHDGASFRAAFASVSADVEIPSRLGTFDPNSLVIASLHPTPPIGSKSSQPAQRVLTANGNRKRDGTARCFSLDG